MAKERLQKIVSSRGVASRRKAEELTGTERNERQCDIRHKIHSIHNASWDQIQAVRPHKHTGYDIRRHVGKTKFFGDTGHQKTKKQHKGNRASFRFKENGISKLVKSTTQQAIFKYNLGTKGQLP